jgi:hypothetical protein
MRINVRFNGKWDRKVIEDLGGTVIDELENIPDVAIVDIPDDDDKTFKKLQKHTKVKHTSKARWHKGHTDIPVIPEEKWAKGNSVSNSYPDYNTFGSYHHQALNLKDFWDRGLTGKGMKIGLIDSAGVNHIWLPVKNGIVYDSSIPDYYYAHNSHSTSCAGILTGKPVYTGNPATKSSGVAPDADLYVAVCGQVGRNTDVNESYAISAINWMISQKVDCISISWGSIGPSDASFDAATTAAWNAGIPIFVSIGNDGTATITDIDDFPANAAYCLGIAGINETYSRWLDPASTTDPGSTTSSDIWATACANNVRTAWADSANPTVVQTIGTNFTGTSAASPMAAGLYALYKQAFPDKKVSEIIAIMQNSTRQLGTYTVKNLEFGYGLLQPSPEILNQSIPVRKGLVLEEHTTRVFAPINSTLNSLANNFTAEITFSMEAMSGAWIVQKYDNTANNTIWGLYLDVYNEMIYSYNNGTPQLNWYWYNYKSAFISKQPQTWHLVFTYPNMYLYRNGERVDPGTWTCQANGYETGTIANSQIKFCGFLKGAFYNARLYNRVLTASEIATVNKGMRVSNGLLLEYIPKGDETGTILDTSGNGFHGTLQGGMTPTIKRINFS